MLSQRKKLQGLFVVSGLLLVVISSAWAHKAGFSLQRNDPPTLNNHPAYAQVTTVTGPAKMIYVAGQVDRPIDYEPRSNNCRSSDWYGQYLGAMKNVEAALAAEGATWHDVVFIRRYITDWRAWRAMTKERADDLPDFWKGQRPPPSTMIQVVALSEPCQLIEIDVVAAVGVTEG